MGFKPLPHELTPEEGQVVRVWTRAVTVIYGIVVIAAIALAGLTYHRDGEAQVAAAHVASGAGGGERAHP